MLNKQQVLNLVIEKLEAELEVHHRAAGSAFSEATDAENIAENKYDTRGLEASYLARGHALKTDELETGLSQLRALELSEEPAPIAIGSLVTLSLNNHEFGFFLLPGAGGVELNVDGLEISVISLHSPLGLKLTGLKSGDSVTMPTGKLARITAVS